MGQSREIVHQQPARFVRTDYAAFWRTSLCKKRRARNDGGMVLVGTIGVMIFAALFTAIGTSIVTTSAGSHSNLIQGAQALAIAHGGAEWYLQQLAADTDWTNEANQSKSFAEGSFTISISSAAAMAVTFTSTGSVTSTLSDVTVQRQVSMTAQKLTPAFRFAVYEGIDPGSNFLITNNGADTSTVTGDVWARGTVQVNSTNTVTGGKVYVPDNETVTGTGSYTSKLVASPYLNMPVIDASYYTNLIATYNALLDADTSTADTTVGAGQTFTVSGTMNYRNFTTSGANVTINGSGTIVANRSIDMHIGAGSLTITPTAGGSITILASRTLTLGATSDPTINVSSGVTFYSRAATGTGQRVQIQGNATTLNSDTLIGNRRIIIDTGADLLGNNMLFVNYPGSDTNNMINIVGDTDVTTVQGSLISLSRNDPGIKLENADTTKTRAVITGLVYAYGSATTGYCRVEDVTVHGSIVCTRFSNDRIRNSNVDYSNSYLPSTPPQGFEGFVVTKQNSWDGV